MAAPKSLVLDSITCHSKTNKERYVDYLQIRLIVRKATPNGPEVIHRRAIILGDRTKTDSIPKFGNGLLWKFRDHPELPVTVLSGEGSTGDLTEEPVRPIKVADLSFEKAGNISDNLSVQIDLINDRYVSDPYLLAKALLIVGGLTAGGLAAYGVGQVGGAPGDLNNGNIVDLAKKLIASDVAKDIFGALMEKISDVFKHWPTCGGTVFSKTVSMQDNVGQSSLRTEDITFPPGCGRPDYEVGFTLSNTGFDLVAPEPSRRCEFTPSIAESIKSWEGPQLIRNAYVLPGFESKPGSPIVVSVTQEGHSESATVTIVEMSPQGEKLVDQRRINITQQISEVQKRPNGIKFVQGDYLIKGSAGLMDAIGRSWKGLFPGDQKDSPRSGIRAITSPITQVIKNMVENIQISIWKARSPGALGSVIEIPDIDVRMELHKKVCFEFLDGKKVENSGVVRENVIFYWRGYSTPTGNSDSLSDSAAVLAPSNLIG